MRKRMVVCVALMLVLESVPARAQNVGPDVKEYLSLIESGHAEQVRSELPSLMTRFPNNPGVLYLQGALTRDGAEAVRIYQSVVDNFPKSEWADDALYKVYQFYYALGLYRTAELKMVQLKKNYPDSKHLTRGNNVETRDFAEEKEQPVSTARDTLSLARQQESPPTNQTAAGEPEVVAKPEGVPSRQTVSLDQFVLQVGAYSSQVNAEKQKIFFENLEFPVEVITKVKNARSLYIVMIGAFGSYDEAKAKGVEIRKKYNIDSIVVTR